jgi:hypothetical protein
MLHTSRSRLAITQHAMGEMAIRRGDWLENCKLHILSRMSEEAVNNAVTALDEVPKTYDRAILVLAAAHAAGPDQVDIYFLRDPEERVVRLIEVSDAFPAGGVDRLVPPDGVEHIVPVFPMGPANDFPFRSEIAQVRRAEWEQLRKGKLQLNRNWGDLSQALKVENGN